MYLGIDVGGTKTLLAVFSKDGRIVDEHRFPSSPKFPKFITELDKCLKTELAEHRIEAACCALAGTLNRQAGVVKVMGNLPWRNVPMLQDLQQVFGHSPVFIENDAKLAGLSEALAVKHLYRDVLYVTIGTGVGIAHVVDGQIDLDISDKGGRGLVLEHDGQLMDWDDIASGKALVKRFGKPASQIEDPQIWAEFCVDLARGLEHFVSATKPEIIIVGGGVGSHFDKFGAVLNKLLAEHSTAKLKMPEAIPAVRPEEAVIYGCYDFIRQKLEGKA